MTIKSIEINNFKSIEHLKITINNLNTFIGKNGTGKSTIMKAVKYFYDNLLEDNIDNKVFDQNNMYKKEMSIIIEYDFKRIFEHSDGSFNRKIRKILGISLNSLNGFTLTDYSIKVKLTQIKHSEILWNFGYDDRYIFKNTHPIYFLYPREIDLQNWDESWDILGELMNANFAKNIDKDISTLLSSEDKHKFLDYTKSLKDFFSDNHLKLSPMSNQHKVVSLLQLQLGGEKFMGNEKDFDYFSDGTNSKNYLLFLSFLAYQINLKRLKDVTLIMDEPELGLHPKMIDDFMDQIVSFSKRVNFIIFSHSSRLTAHVLKGKGDVYKLWNFNDYTITKKLVKNNSVRTRLQVTEREASFLFSDFLLFVEGVTEFELFTHPYLIQLFPFLKDIDIVNTNSNDIILSLLNSDNNKSEIPFLNLIDLDKIVEFTPLENDPNVFKLTFKNLHYSYIKNCKKKKKLILSHQLYKDSIDLLNDIEGYHQYEFQQIYDWGGIEDSFFYLYNKILSFSKKFNLYPIRIDIELALTSNKYFFQWFKSIKDVDIVKSATLSNNREIYMLNSFLTSGKNDFLKNLNIEKYTPKSLLPYKPLLTNRVKKNSEWLTNYLNFYSEKMLETKLSNKELINCFHEDFPIIYDIIGTIKSLMR